MSTAPRLGWDWMRRRGVVAVLVGGSAVLLLTGHAHYPIQHWLFWRFAGYWLACAVWAFSCLFAGSWLAQRLGWSILPATEFLLASFAVGVLSFFLVMFAGGIAGIFSPALAVAWPAVACLLGGRLALRRLRRLGRLLLAPKPVSPGRLAIGGFGLIGLAMVYLTIISPENVGFDARWYHLPIAEHYIAAGRIVPFEEGWYLGIYPHLASIVYAWAFLLPGTQLFDRILLAAHLEFVFFLVTLGSIPLMVRKLIGGPLRWESFAALFLFPGVFVYDGSLFVAADHVLAFWAIPIYLSVLRSAKEPTWRRLSLTAALLAGALLTKYQAVYFLVPSACALLWACFRRSRREALRSASASIAAAAALGLVLTAPHWLANWVWYGDPLYPMLHAHLPSRPFSEAAARHLDIFFGTASWVPQGSTWSKLVEAARVLVTFSFVPHDWATYHGMVPIFGSLFTLLSALIFFLPSARRIVPVIAAVLVGVGIWFLTSHQDRYLQCLVPVMASATFALAYLAYRDLPSARAPLALLIGLQIVWGGDALFIPANDASHEVDRPSPIKSAVDLLSSGYRGRYDERLHLFPPWESIGAMLPGNAKVLLHERYLHLGLGRMSVSDLPGWQGGLYYADLQHSRTIADRLHALGVTHLVWETAKSHELGSIASDVAFFRFATQWTEEARTLGAFTIATLTSRQPPPKDGDIAWYDCPNDARSLLRFEDIDEGTDPVSIPALEETAEPPREADVAVVNRDCHAGSLPPRWELGAHRGRYALWFRRAPHRMGEISALDPLPDLPSIR